jgi:hypothetical protein
MGGVKLPIDGLSAGCCQEIDAAKCFFIWVMYKYSGGTPEISLAITLFDGTLLENFSQGGLPSEKVAKLLWKRRRTFALWHYASPNDPP